MAQLIKELFRRLVLVPLGALTTAALLGVPAGIVLFITAAVPLLLVSRGLSEDVAAALSLLTLLVPPPAVFVAFLVGGDPRRRVSRWMGAVYGGLASAFCHVVIVPLVEFFNPVQVIFSGVALVVFFAGYAIMGPLAAAFGPLVLVFGFFLPADLADGVHNRLNEWWASRNTPRHRPARDGGRYMGDDR
jgi:hypothetical protein